MLLSLHILPLFRGYQYRLFLISHLGIAGGLIYVTWCHIRTSGSLPRQSVLVAIAAFCLTTSFRLIRAVWRNLTYRKSLTRVEVVNEGNPEETKGLFQIVVAPPRSWEVKAGEWVNLGVPYVGVFYLPHLYPFMIAWSENDATGQVKLYLLAKPRSGFTRRILCRMSPHKQYRAWVEGPYGPPTIGKWGRPTRLADHNHVVMFATGVGIAAQIPHIRQILLERNKSRALTKRISLLWEPDDIGNIRQDQFMNA